MGYANTLPQEVITLSSGGSPSSKTLSSVAATQSFNDVFDVPAWVRGRLKYAYLVMYVPYQQDTSGAGVNWTSGDTYIQVSTDGIAWNNAILIPSASFIANSGATEYKFLRRIGAYNIVDYGITATSITVQWLNAKSTRDNLVLSNIYFELFCIIE